ANVFQNNPGAMPPNRFPPPQPFNQQNLIVPQPGNGQPAVGQPADAEADDSKDDEDNADDNADDQAQPQPGQPGQPNMNVQDQTQQPDPNQPNAGPKTPEQILEMLRRQQPGAPVMPPPQ